jgi:NAD(P)-dependent dehydrogenase (short-subunit alcohol dehydrogenase family)
MEYTGTTIVITGGASGIGRGIAHAFATTGANVVVFDVAAPTDAVRFFSVDVRRETSIRGAAVALERVDVLVNSAGVYWQGPFGTMSAADLDTVVDVNLKGSYLVTKYLLPHLTTSRGCIINIASGLGMAADPLAAAYCATKAGIIMLTRCLALDFKTHGVRVNAILPGPIDTPMLRDAISSDQDLAAYIRLNPMRRIGQPADVAALALFLASDAARYINGGIYAVDGGESVTSAYS